MFRENPLNETIEKDKYHQFSAPYRATCGPTKAFVLLEPPALNAGCRLEEGGVVSDSMCQEHDKHDNKGAKAKDEGT